MSKKEPDTEADFRVLGFRIERSASFTSLAAFLIAVWGIAYTSYGYLRGSLPELVQPERIVVFKDECDHSQFPIANIVQRISVFNKSTKDYSSILHDVQISFRLGIRDYFFSSESYAQFGQATRSKKGKVGCSTKNENLIWYVESKEFVNNELVAGSDLYSEEILFSPNIPSCPSGEMSCYSKNYIDYDRFVELIAEKSKKEGRINFKLSIKYDFNKRQNKNCTVLLNDSVINALKNFSHMDVYCEERLDL